MNDGDRLALGLAVATALAFGALGAVVVYWLGVEALRAGAPQSR